MFSDDTGVTWQRSAGLSGGDEADVAELADGSLYLTACHRARISRAPEPNTRQFSISSDISAQWPDAQVDARLSTPVCQATVLSTESGDLLFANPAHSHSRAHMTVRRSSDNGASWPSEVMVYPGPAGYSVLAQGSDGDIYLLYENGNMAYSERISVARIEPDSLLSIR